MCARIIGNSSPRATTILASTPVSSAGSTTCTGTAAWPARSRSLYQCTRNRFALFGLVRVHVRQRSADRRRDAVRRGQLREGGQQDAGRAEPVDGAAVGVAVDDVVLESEGGQRQNPVITEKPRVS